MGASLTAITNRPLTLEALVDAVAGYDQAALGAVTSFLGVVSGENLGRRVTHLEYEAYEPLAVRALERIRREVSERWPSVRAGRPPSRSDDWRSAKRAWPLPPLRRIVPRPLRRAATRSSAIKQIAPVWKHEYFEGGDVWIEGATADPDDEAAREAALRRACA